MKKFVVILVCSMLAGCFSTISSDQVNIAETYCLSRGGISYYKANSILDNYARCIDGSLIFLEGEKK